MKISPRLLHIAAYLLAQRVNRGKFNLIPHPLQKTYFNFGLRRQFNGMEIQQMRFDRKQFCSKRWTIAHIRDRIKPLVPTRVHVT